MSDLKDTLGMSERTIYSYIDTFKTAGLAADIQIIEGEGLKDYIRNYVSDYQAIIK